MSTGDKRMPKYDESKANVQFNPLQYQESQDYRNILNQIGQTVASNPTQPITDTGWNYAQNILNPNYSAFTPEQQQGMVDQRTKQAEKGFQNTRNQIGSRLANSRLAGSGVGEMDWTGQGKNEAEAVTGIVNDVGNQNIAATQANKSQAFGALPALGQMSQIPLQNQMAYGGMLGTDEASKNAFGQWNKTMGQQANMANVKSYLDYFKQKSNRATANQGAWGGALGGLVGK